MNNESKAYSISLSQNVQQQFDFIRQSFSLTFSNGNRRDCSAEKLAELIIFESEQLADSKNVSRQINSLISKAELTKSWLAKIARWVDCLKRYEDEEFLVKAKKSPELEKVNIDFTVLRVALPQAEEAIKQLNDFWEGKNVQPAYNLGDVTLREAKDFFVKEAPPLAVALVTADYFAELAMDELSELFDRVNDYDLFNEVFPPLTFIKDVPVIIHFSSEERELALFLVRHASKTGFDQVTVGIFEYLFETDTTSAEFDQLTFNETALYIADRLNEKDITYIAPENSVALNAFLTK